MTWTYNDMNFLQLKWPNHPTATSKMIDNNSKTNKDEKYLNATIKWLIEKSNKSKDNWESTAN